MAKADSVNPSNGSAPATNVELGAFPFPLTEGPDESRYLTWLRNHSNYMAVRGFLDYLRSAGVLVRGIIVNFLIFLPWLLLVAIVLGYAHHFMLDNPFLLTWIAGTVAVGWILLFPILMPLFRIFTYKKSVETGSESTVKQRDLYERSFGGLLLAVVAVAVLESLPWALELLNDLLQDAEVGWGSGLATVAAALAFLSGSDKLLSVLSGAKKTVAMVLIGILGLLVPLLVILYATDFLIYGAPPTPSWMFSPLVVPLVGVVGITIAIALGLWRRAFSLKEGAVVSGMLVGGLALVAVAVVGGVQVTDATFEGTKTLRTKVTEPFRSLAEGFKEIPKDALDPMVTASVDEVLRLTERQGDTQLRSPWPPQVSDEGLLSYLLHAPWREVREFLYSDPWQAVRKFDIPVIELGDELSALPAESLKPLQKTVADRAFGELLKLIPDRFGMANRNRQKGIANSLRMALVQKVIEDSCGEGDETAECIERATVNAKAYLEFRPIDQIAKLVFEDQLTDLVALKVEHSDTLANLAELTGKKELASLVTPEEMVELVFPDETFAEDVLGDKTLANEVLRGEEDFRTRHLVAMVRSELARIALPQAVAPTYAQDAGFLVPGEGSLASAEKLDLANRLIQLIRGGAARAAAPQPPVDLPSEDFQDGPVVKVISEDGTLPPEEASPEETFDLVREKLADLALMDFSPEQLGMILNDQAFTKRFWDAHQFFDESSLGEASVLEFVAKLAFGDTGIVAKLAFDDVGGDLMSRDEAEQAGAESYPDVYKLLLALKAFQYDGYSSGRLELLRLTRKKLLTMADEIFADPKKGRTARDVLASVGPYRFESDELAEVAAAKLYWADEEADKLVAAIMFGKYAAMEEGDLGGMKRALTDALMPPKAVFVFLLAAVTWFACWFTVDVNLTSIHGLYRDRLASAFLVGQDTHGDVDIEEDVDLADLCRYEARSTAPYHLVNAALNLQGSKDIAIRDRNSDFFIFSKRFVGGERTGYCRSETLDNVFPQMSLATAMAVSAAAASPNMGRGTSRSLVAFLTLLNIRLGYWMPNPGLLEEKQDKAAWRQGQRQARRARRKEPSRKRGRSARRADQPTGFTFEEVFRAELEEIEQRWSQVYGSAAERQLAETRNPSVLHGLAGIAFSGGGIRSATVNLGIVQALHSRGVFDHLDYMSTVSGGGYLGSSISTLMRSKTKLTTEIEGTVKIVDSDTKTTVKVDGEGGNSKSYEFSNSAELDVEHGQNVGAGKWLITRRGATSQSAIAGTVKVQRSEAGDHIVWVSNKSGDDERVYLLPKADQLMVKTGKTIDKGELLNTPGKTGGKTEGKTDGEDDGDDDSNRNPATSDIAGTVTVSAADAAEQFVSIASQSSDKVHVHRFSRFERVIVKTGDTVAVGQPLIRRPNTFGERFSWRVRPSAFLREMTSKLDETHRWVNLSDGGHLENLATIELLRRRCKYIIVGDAEADEKLHFPGLATLMRSAYIDLGIEIDIDLDALRLRKAREDDDTPTVSGAQWALGKIKYPKTSDFGEEEGTLLYLKSSFTGREGEVIQEYRHRDPSFPHQTTADQMFDEGQFEAYRALGQHIAEQALACVPRGVPRDVSRDVSNRPDDATALSFDEFKGWFEALETAQEARNGTGAPTAKTGAPQARKDKKPKRKKRKKARKMVGA